MSRLPFMPSLRLPAMRPVATAAIAVLAACSTPDSRGARTDSSSASEQATHVADVAAKGGVVDSILPIAEHLRRFRVGLDSTDTLAHASPSREELVARWAKAVAANDTADLNAMLLSRSEFAWLYYPESPMSKPPYEAPPELLWGQLLASSNKGASQLVRRFGGSTAKATALRCPAPPEPLGANLLHTKCEVRLTAPGRETLQGILFGTIIERGGRFKFVGLSTNL